MDNNSDVIAGNVYKLDTRHPSGARFIQVIDVRRSACECVLGHAAQGEFTRRSYNGSDGRPIRSITVKASKLGTFQFNKPIQNIKEITKAMAKKNQENPTEQTEDSGLTYEMDTPTGTAPVGAKVKAPEAATTKVRPTGSPKTFEERKKAIEEAKQKEIDALAKKEKAMAEAKAKREKEAEKKKREAEKAAEKKKNDREQEKQRKAAEGRAKKLQAAVDKAGMKEAEFIAEFTQSDAALFPEALPKKFVQFSEEATTQALARLKTIAADKAKSDKLALSTSLTDAEAKELAGFEKRIERYLPTFQSAAFEIGACLLGITQKRLYRAYQVPGAPEGHKATVAEYIEHRFGISRPYAYQVMSAAQTFHAITDGQQVDVKSLPAIRVADAITRGVRGLLKEANVQDDPETNAIMRAMARNTYDLLVQDAPKDADGKPILSPGHIESTFKVLSEVAKSGVVDTGDGKQVPVNLAAATIDEMITGESKERTLRAKQWIADQIQRERDTPKEVDALPSGSSTASASGNGMVLPTQVVPKIIVTCSHHGRNTIKETSDNDIKLGCGCVFVSTPDGYLFDETSRPKG